MTTDFKRAFLFTTLVLLLFSCSQKEDISIDKNKTHANGLIYSTDGQIKLGEKKQNPYSVENMKQAYARLSQSSSFKESASGSPVKTTHLYIRILPDSWEAYDIIKSDTALKLYDIPFEYDIELNGSEYHDPSIPMDKPTWQYTCVPVDFTLSSIPSHYEIISELYLPESDEGMDDELSRTVINNEEFVDALVDEAMILTENFSDTLSSVGNDGTLKKNKNSSWNPSGTIRVYDTRLQKLIPLVGVKIRARRWFDIREVYTNDNGYFVTSGFKREVNYALYYETAKFDVRSGTYGQAWINGPKQKGDWNIDSWDGVQRFYSHVFRGARRYQYGNIAGLKRPNVWSKLKYCAFNKTGSAQGANWGNWDPTGIFPDIQIWSKKSTGVEYDSDEIFSTAIHETAHASHIELMNVGEIQYSQVSKIIFESWATAVEWKITQMEYLERGADPLYANPWWGLGTSISYPLKQAFQYWNKEHFLPEYTCLFIDLTDDFNQRLMYKGTGYFLANDNPAQDWVTGYTLPQIEKMLKHVYGLSSLNSTLKENKPTGVTDQQIDLLFSYF